MAGRKKEEGRHLDLKRLSLHDFLQRVRFVRQLANLMQSLVM
jgi:hypothetical protein